MRIRSKIIASVYVTILILVGFWWWRSSIVLDQLTLSSTRQYFLTSHGSVIYLGFATGEKVALSSAVAMNMPGNPRNYVPYSKSLRLEWWNVETEEQPIFDVNGGNLTMMTYGIPFGSNPKLHHVSSISASYWLIFLLWLFAPIPFLFRAALHRQWLRNYGKCSRCGYDLRATPFRCPECGQDVESKFPIQN